MFTNFTHHHFLGFNAMYGIIGKDAGGSMSTSTNVSDTLAYP